MLIGGGISLQVEHLHCPKKSISTPVFFHVDPIIKCFSGYGEGIRMCSLSDFHAGDTGAFPGRGAYKTAQHLPGTSRQTNRTLIHAAFSQWQHRHTSRRKTTTKTRIVDRVRFRASLNCSVISGIIEQIGWHPSGISDEKQQLNKRKWWLRTFVLQTRHA